MSIGKKMNRKKQIACNKNADNENKIYANNHESNHESNHENNNYDSAWKKVIRNLLKDFLQFFFTDIHDAIDFSKKVTFLDKELKEIDPDSNQGDRVADVLVKVHLKDGSTKYICIIAHIEVQSDPGLNFEERMFIYYYRAFDKEKEEKIPVISLALLTDDCESFRPDGYYFEFLGFEISMKFPTVKIIDYKSDKLLKKKLETSTNPITMVVKAQLKSHEVKKADENRRFEVTKELIRQCYKKGYSKKETHIILNFFDWVIRLPEAYKEKIKTVIKKAEEENKMEYIATWERDWYYEGMAKGEVKGEKRGIAKGEVKGEKRGIAKGVAMNKEEMVKKLLTTGVDIDTIINVSGLSKKEIESLMPKSS
jgi:hypothetical protein